MDLLDKDYIKKLLSDVESSQNRERREAEIKSFEVYSGKLNDHVTNRIKEIYPKTWSSFSISDLNLSRKITDKKSKAYKQSPIRELATDNETQEYSSLMKSMNASQAWQTFDVYYNLHRHAAMWFNYIEKDGEVKLVLRPLTPFQFSRVVDKTGETLVFIVNFPTSELYETTDTDGRKALIQDSQQDSVGVKRYAIWSKDQHVVVRMSYAKDSSDVMVSYEPIDGNQYSVNDLGVIPAAFAQEGDNAALPLINPITNQVVEFNQQYSVMLTGNSLNTFGHLVLSHPEDQKMPDEIYNSLFTYSRLPQKEGDVATTLDYLSPSSNTAACLEVLRDYGTQIITEHLGDGSQSLSNSDSFKSGLDRMIAMSDISNIIESNQQVYARVENDLYKVIKAYYVALNDLRFKSESITVKYNKAKPIQSESEILANIKMKLDLGLIEKYEALLMLDPNMSAEAAKDKIEKVKLEKKENMETFMGEFNGNTDNQIN